ncbi:MAG TPA: hypothetical protein VGH28_18235 [Polyangiaceae bacterium]
MERETEPPPKPVTSGVPTERPLAREPEERDRLGATAVAQLRHEIASLQAQLAETQQKLAREQQERAEDADRLAEMLSHVSNSEARVRAAEGRAESEMTGITHEATVLRERVSRQEDELIATSLEIEQGRRALAAAQEEAAAARAEAAELRSAKEELAHATAALEMAQKHLADQKAELAKVQGTLRLAQTRAFTANRQFESWKKDHEAQVRTTSERADRRAQSMRKYIEASTEMLRLTATALEGIERGELEMDRMRETQRAERRAVLERALAVRESLRKAASGDFDGEVTVEVTEELWTEETPDDDG